MHESALFFFEDCLMKKIILMSVISVFLAFPLMASETETDLFPLLDMDKSGDISFLEFNMFVESIVEQKIADMGIFGDLPMDSPNIRIYKEEIIKGLLNGTKQFFEMQDKDGNLIITAEEYNNSLFQPLLKIGE